MLTIIEYRNSFAQNGKIGNKLSDKLLQVQNLNTVINVRKKDRLSSCHDRDDIIDSAFN